MRSLPRLLIYVVVLITSFNSFAQLGSSVCIGFPSPHLWGIQGFDSNRHQSFFVTSGPEGAKLWDVNSGKLIRTLAGSAEGVSTVNVSPDGKTIVSTGIEENKLRFWNSYSGKLLGMIPLDDHLIISQVEFTPDSKYCIAHARLRDFSATKNNEREEITLISIFDLKLTKKIKLEKSESFAMTVSGDGKYLAVVSTTNKVKPILELYSLPSGARMRQVILPPASPKFTLKEISFSSSGLELIRAFVSSDSVAVQIIDPGKGSSRNTFAGNDIWISAFGTWLFIREGEQLKVVRCRDNSLIGSVDFPATAYAENLPNLSSVDNRFAIAIEDQVYVFEISVEDKINVLQSFPGGLSDDYRKFAGSKYSVFTADNQIVAGTNDSAFKIDSLISPIALDSLKSYGLASFSMDETGIQRGFTISSPRTGKTYSLNVGQDNVGLCSADINHHENMMITSAFENMLNFQLWDSNGLLLLTWKQVTPTGWIAYHPSGLFDASEDIVRELYFVEGLTIFDFSSYASVYRERGLLQKILSRVPLRKVEK